MSRMRISLSLESVIALFGRQDKIGIAFDLTFQRRLVTGEVEKFENIAPQS